MRRRASPSFPSQPSGAVEIRYRESRYMTRLLEASVAVVAGELWELVSRRAGAELESRRRRAGGAGEEASSWGAVEQSSMASLASWRGKASGALVAGRNLQIYKFTNLQIYFLAP